MKYTFIAAMFALSAFTLAACGEKKKEEAPVEAPAEHAPAEAPATPEAAPAETPAHEEAAPAEHAPEAK